MAEVNSLQAANVAAKTKNRSGDHNRLRSAVITMPATWSASNGDTVATKQVLPPQARVVDVVVSNGTGAASSTVSVGYRKAKDGTSAVAAGLASAVAITTAATARPVNGTLIQNGLDGLMPAYETELYLTFGGANPTANQALKVIVTYIAP